jgi:hypothetical protein
MFPERDHPKQKCRGGRRPNGGVGRGLHPERTSRAERALTRTATSESPLE